VTPQDYDIKQPRFFHIKNGVDILIPMNIQLDVFYHIQFQQHNGVYIQAIMVNSNVL